MTITGQVTDNSGKAVEFGKVYVSDSKGKAIGNNSTDTDDKGRFILSNVNKSDSISVVMVGLKTATSPVSKAIQLSEATLPILAIRMQPSEAVNLNEIKVTPNDNQAPIDKKKIDSKDKKKDETKPNWLMIGLIAGGGLLVLTLIVVALRNKNER